MVLVSLTGGVCIRSSGPSYCKLAEALSASVLRVHTERHTPSTNRDETEKEKEEKSNGMKASGVWNFLYDKVRLLNFINTEKLSRYTENVLSKFTYTNAIRWIAVERKICWSNEVIVINRYIVSTDLWPDLQRRSRWSNDFIGPQRNLFNFVVGIDNVAGNITTHRQYIGVETVGRFADYRKVERISKTIEAFVVVKKLKGVVERRRSVA